MNLVELSQRLKSLRTERGKTLEEVATAAGLTRGWLSKVENFRLTPSLTALAQIADALDVSMSELFAGLDEKPKVVIVPSTARKTMERDTGISELVYEALAHTRPSRRMDPFVITVPKTDHRPLMNHAGEEFLFVLQGPVVLEYDGQSHKMHTGDAAYFDSSIDHRLVNEDETPAQVLSVFYGENETI